MGNVLLIVNNYIEMLHESGMIGNSAMVDNLKVQNAQGLESTNCKSTEGSGEDYDIHGVRSRITCTGSSRLLEDFGMKSQESCKYDGNVRLRDGMKQISR